MDKRILPFDKFVDHCNKIFNNKYDYSQSEYIGMKHPIKIICPIHGEFFQKAHSHYLGHHCNKCNGSPKISDDEILKQFKNKHGDKYDYSKVKYINGKKPVEIICKKHGSFFQSPYEHKNGQGCPKCIKNRRLNRELFIEISNDVHDFIYNYDKVDFVNSKEKVIVTCKNHGDFKISPNHHMRSQGCPNCKRSLGELKILKYLKQNNIDYIQQKYFNDLVSGKKRYLFFDFFLPNRNICIEYDGQQHFIPLQRFGGLESYQKLKEYDLMKDKYCEDKNINLIRIPYTDIKNIDNILDNILNSN